MPEGYKKTLGAKGEDAAAEYLKGKGMEILARNFTIRGGEIDIIARDGECTVYVEVKTRTNAAFGRGSDAVDIKKRRAMVRAAIAYAERNGITDTAQRFDVIEVAPRGESAHITHFKYAFLMNDV